MTNPQSWWPSASGGQSPFQPSSGNSQGSGLFGLGLVRPSGTQSPPSITPSPTPSITPTPGVGSSSPNILQALLGKLFPNANSGPMQSGPLHDLFAKLFPNGPWAQPQATPAAAPAGPVANATPGINSGASMLKYNGPVAPLTGTPQTPVNQVY